MRGLRNGYSVHALPLPERDRSLLSLVCHLSTRIETLSCFFSLSLSLSLSLCRPRRVDSIPKLIGVRFCVNGGDYAHNMGYTHNMVTLINNKKERREEKQIAH